MEFLGHPTAFYSLRHSHSGDSNRGPSTGPSSSRTLEEVHLEEVPSAFEGSQRPCACPFFFSTRETATLTDDRIVFTRSAALFGDQLQPLEEKFSLKDIQHLTTIIDRRFRYLIFASLGFYAQSLLNDEDEGTAIVTRALLWILSLLALFHFFINVGTKGEVILVFKQSQNVTDWKVMLDRWMLGRYGSSFAKVVPMPLAEGRTLTKALYSRLFRSQRPTDALAHRAAQYRPVPLDRPGPSYSIIPEDNVD